MVGQSYIVSVTTGSGISPKHIEDAIRLHLLNLGFDYRNLTIVVEEVGGSVFEVSK